MSLPAELQKKLENVSNLPSPSQVAMAIMDLAKDPNLNLASVAGLINKDPALATKILRTANSAMFAQRRKSNNLRKALIVLGLNATLTLALSFSLVNKFRKQQVQGVNLPHFWRNCLLSASAARVCGEVLGHNDTENLFLAGLLQDIGVLALDKCESGFYTEIDPGQFDHALLVDFETAKLGVDHAEIGSWLLDHWNMPKVLVDAVAVSHCGGQAIDNVFDACVAMSGPIAQFCSQAEDDADMAALAQQFHATTGKPDSVLGDVLMRLHEQVPDVEALYESDLIEAERATQIVEQAREILMNRNLQALRSAESRNEELEEINRRDALTGVFNRSHMMQTLEQEFSASKQNAWPLSVAFVDLDKFKQINDTLGHLAGDQLLKSIAETLVDRLRDSDIVTRYGGDEFVIIMPGTDTEMATAAARRVTACLSSVKHDLGDGNELIVTISMGVASLDRSCSFDSVDELLAAADAAVYAVKQAGRNSFATWASLAESEQLQSAPSRDYRSPEVVTT